MMKIISFIHNSYVELVLKSTWPKLSQLQSSSILVLVASMIFALFIGLIDYGFDNIIGWFYKEF